MASSRITHNPEQCGGKPCIRGKRIRVRDVLELYAAGLSSEQILADYPDLEPEDPRVSGQGIADPRSLAMAKCQSLTIASANQELANAAEALGLAFQLIT